MTDMTCLAEGLVFPTDFNQTGINSNEIVVGPTGCGKSFSNSYSRLLHTTDSSVVVPIAKKAIRDRFSAMFKQRGYQVINLDFSHPEKCKTGYDPLDYIHNELDIIQTARNLIGKDASKGRTGEQDPYWNDSATSVLGAEIALSILNAKADNRTPTFADVIKLHRSIKFEIDNNLMKTNIDFLFEKAGRKYPGNQATELWKTVKDLAPRTASCIFSIVNSALDKVFSENIIKMLKKGKRINFSDLGKKKIALFITTSPMNKTLQNFVNLLYADMFRELFETAEKNDNGSLSVPVHIICDDFACGSRIGNFEEYISIFRAAGISVTILLQSESQLYSMYGEADAVTIINNCDTYVYMGGMDIVTCEHIAKRMNKPVHKVMSMGLEQVAVFRRGNDPFCGRRYQTLQDPLYKDMISAGRKLQDEHEIL